MAQSTYPLGNAPTIVIQTCNGDLDIVGQSEETGTVTVVSGVITQYARLGDQFVIQRCEDVRLAVPAETKLVVQHVAGDAHVERLASAQINTVGGDLEAEAIASSCTLTTVGGDTHVADAGTLALATADGDVHLERIARGANISRVAGDMHGQDIASLALEEVDGDARLEGLSGTLRLKRVHGDAVLRGAVDGFGPTVVDGDLTLDLRYTPGHEYQLTVDGDATIVLAEDANLTLRAHVMGDIVGLDTSIHDEDGATRATWGEGSAHLSIRVDGDLRVRASGAAFNAAPPTATPIGTPATPPATAPSPSPSDSASPATDVPQTTETASPNEDDDAPMPSDSAAPAHAMLAVLEALARGEISPAEADDILARRAHDPTAR